MGKQPLNAGVLALVNVIEPDNTSKWSLSLSFHFLFPEGKLKLIN